MICQKVMHGSDCSCSGTTTTYAYDLSSRLVSATNAAGTLAFAYDRLGRLVQFTDGYGKSLQYAYDLNGNRVQLAYPGGGSVASEFDAVDRLVAIKDASSADIATFAYNPLSQITQSAYGNGTYTTYSYDGLGFLQGIQHQLGLVGRDYAYSLDRLGNIWAKTAPGAAVHTYLYDDVYQLVQAEYPGNDVSTYTYDALGNRQSVGNNGASVSYTSNAMNQYTLVDGVALVYDGNGNTTSDGARTFEYDSENRLTKVVSADHIVEYGYDALGRRVERRVYDASYALQKTVRYLHDGADVVCEYDGAGTETARYVLAGLDRPVRRTNAGGGHYYYHADALGSVTEISDSTGDFVEAYEYDAYGEFPSWTPLEFKWSMAWGLRSSSRRLGMNISSRGGTARSKPASITIVPASMMRI